MSDHASFVAALGEEFTLADGSTLTLDDVGDLHDGVEYATFSIVLRGPSDRPIAQGTHVLGHHRLGELAIFLVPIGITDDQLEYEAVFSQRADADGQDPTVA